MGKSELAIGILTYSRSINYGAFLQCYSLYKQLSKLADNIQIINYDLRLPEIGFYIQSIQRGFFRGLEQYNIIREFGEKELNFTKKIVTHSYKKSIDYLNSLNLDLIVAGSDEIWKINKLRPYPNIYWASNELDAKKISYAASANRTYTKKLSANEIESIKEELHNYLYLGVRDNHTYNLLHELGLGERVFMNCDPAFFYEFNETPALKEKLVSKYKLNLDKPVIGLLTGNKDVGKALKDHFGDEYQIVAITCNNKYADQWLYDLDPFEWANVFKYFTGCVSSYFHGTIFSILSGVPLVAFDSEEFSLSYETKIFDLIQKTGLEQCYINILKDPVENIAKILVNNIENKVNLRKKFKDVSKSEQMKYKSFETEFKRIIKNL